MAKTSPRQEVGNFVGAGDFRSVFEQNPQGLTQEAIELMVRVLLNYCEPRRKRKLYKYKKHGN